MDNVNIKVLAEELNLSTSTVSRAFRGNSDINPQTKERILAAAKAIGYQPNVYASSLRDRKSRTVAIVVPEFANNFFSKAIKGIERVARDNGYHTLIYVTDDDVQKEEAFVTEVCNGRVEGLIMSASGEGHKHNYLQVLERRHIPLVFFDRYYEDVRAERVTADDYESSKAATKLLIEKGCKRIAYLVVNKGLSIGKIRMQGYADALAEAGMAIDESLVLECSNDYAKIYDTLKDAFHQLKPDGAFASVERLAVSAYRVCRNECIRIPADLKIISFSSLEIADILDPSLSTVTQPAYDMGELAARRLFRILKGEGANPDAELLQLRSEIIPRDSTG